LSPAREAALEARQRVVAMDKEQEKRILTQKRAVKKGDFFLGGYLYGGFKLQEL